MEFWPENQSQLPLYSKFGTVPGRNCTHNYHDRHQATHYPLYYGEQQDQGRESSYWTVPGSRTGGAPQEYTSWMDQELTARTSSHFPFILDRHPQQHQDLGEYQSHEARDREWTAAQRAAREYERGFVREGWQRRWEPCNPVRYNRDVSTKRSDSSHRELEAWAARYSHSLPRRRRIEAELRGASQGLLESSRAPERDSRSGTDPRVAALQQVLQSANTRESGLWDRGGKQQAPTYYPPQTPATDTSHNLDMKEKTDYQRRMFSQPPGYIAPPPYNSPHKSLPVLHHCDTSWEQESKRQTYWSQPTLRKQDVSVELQDHRKGEKEGITKPDGSQYTFPELEGPKHQGQETDASQASSPISVQNTHIQREDMLSLQQPQVLEAVQNKKINEEPSSKVIEGRKFRLNKKTGGMTIFCLVSRIAGSTETPSLPLCTSQTNIQNTELGGVSENLRDSRDINQSDKHADEVDFRAPTLTEQLTTSYVRNLKAQQKETPTCVESEVLEDNLSNKAETDVVSPEKANINDDDSTFGRQVAQSVQPVSVKYPLWRQPSFKNRAETESSSTCLKANREEGESAVLHNEENSEVHPIDIEVRRLDITKGDSKGLLVIDTTCVVVKMELIPSPRKEHVHYLDSTPHTEHSPLDIQSTVSTECVQSNSQLNEDMTTDQNAETNSLDINERPKTELDSDLFETKAPEGESEISFPCMSSSSVSEKETLEERAERILGIPLHDCITEQQPEEDATSLLDSCVEDQEVEPSPVKDNGIDDAVEQIPEDRAEEEQSQNQLEVGQTEDVVCLEENEDAKDQVANEGSEDFAGLQEQVSIMSEENYIESQLQTDSQASPEIEMTEDPLLESISVESTTEQSQEENQPDENGTTSQPPSQYLCPTTDLSDSYLLSPSLDSEAPNPALSLLLSSSDLTFVTDEGPDTELIALSSAENLAPYPETSSLPHTPSQKLPSPPPPGSTDFALSATPHTDPSPSPSPLNLIDQTAEALSGVEDQDEEGETSQLINNEISDALEDLAKDMTEELVSQQLFESGQPKDACVEESNVTDEQQRKEADKDPTDHIMEQKLQISEENAIEVNILQHQLECVQAEDVTCGRESYMTEEQLPKEVSEDPTDQIMEKTLKISKDTAIEVNILHQQHESDMTEEQPPKEVIEDPAGLLEQTTSQENMTDSEIQPEVNILHQQFDNGQEHDVPCLKDSYMIKEQSQKEVSEDPTDHIMEQTLKISKENAIGVNILQHQLECVQAENITCGKESYMTEDQLPKEVSEDPTDQIMEKALKISKDTTIEVNILQQQLESDMTEEQPPKEVIEDPAGLLEQTTSQENMADSEIQPEVNILHQEFDGQEHDASCLKESYMTKEQSQKEVSEDPTDHIMEQTLKISKENAIEVNILQEQLESDLTEEQSQKEATEDPMGNIQTISEENASDSQPQIEIKLLQDIQPQTEPSNSSPPSPAGYEVSQSPLDVLSPSNLPPDASYKSDTEFVSLLQRDSALNPDAAHGVGIPETVPPPLHLDSCEEAPFLLHNSSTPPLQEVCGSVSPDLTLKEEPLSLWDAVNRIRKHTAPDSENEEEEVSELWDPESLGEDLGCLVMVEDMNSEKIVFDEDGQKELSTEKSIEDVEVGQIQQDPCHKEPSGHAEEDTLSCSSTSSTSSGDTVIVADEDEVEETPPDVGTESKTENDKEFQMVEGEQCCSGEAKDGTTAGEEGGDGDESVMNESSQSDECTVEVVNTTTKGVEKMETEQKENDEVFIPTEVPVLDDGIINNESVK